MGLAPKHVGSFELEIEPVSLHWQVDSLLLSPQGGPTIITVDVSFSPLVLSGFALYVFQLC